MELTRAWAMPHKLTFTIKPIAKMLKSEFKGEPYFDPFPFPFKEDALIVMKREASASHEYVVFDPPYTPRQLKEVYGGAGLSYETNASYWSECKKQVSRITKAGGTVISFGYNSGGIGKVRGFSITKILLVCHGGQHNDTICTVEKKVNSTLEESAL